jgi:RND family efflux transporter MFP subunit
MEANWESGSDVCYVGQRFVDEGEMLAPNTPVLSVVDIRNLKAVIHVIERDYPHLVVGQKATIRTDAYPGTVFEGEVLRISKVLKEASRHAEVEIDVDNENLLLRPGMYVRVEIVLSEKEDAVAIPRDALVVNRGKTGVFQLSDEGTTVRWVPIETGIESRDWIEVTSPDIGGGRVVTLGQQLLRDGAAVVVPDGASEPREKTKNP